MGNEGEKNEEDANNMGKVPSGADDTTPKVDGAKSEENG